MELFRRRQQAVDVVPAPDGSLTIQNQTTKAIGTASREVTLHATHHPDIVQATMITERRRKRRVAIAATEGVTAAALLAGGITELTIGIAGGEPELMAVGAGLIAGGLKFVEDAVKRGKKARENRRELRRMGDVFARAAQQPAPDAGAHGHGHGGGDHGGGHH